MSETTKVKIKYLEEENNVLRNKLDTADGESVKLKVNRKRIRKNIGHYLFSGGFRQPGKQQLIAYGQTGRANQ